MLLYTKLIIQLYNLTNNTFKVNYLNGKNILNICIKKNDNFPIKIILG